MAHGYRTLQHWNHWLHDSFLGRSVLAAEAKLLSRILVNHFGKHALLLGVPNQFGLLEAGKLPCHTLVSPFLAHERQPGFIEGDFHDVPIITASVDLVVLPHTLEYMDNPRILINEACRVVKPEGLIVILGFNPYSMWGVKKIISRKNNVPWVANFNQPHIVKNWLKIADCQVENHASTLLRPPIASKRAFDRLEFMECVNNFIPYVGGVYCIVARAKTIPLTPIRMKWKQQLGSIRISTSYTGNIATHSEQSK